MVCRTCRARRKRLLLIDSDVGESKDFQGAVDEHDALIVAMDPNETQQEIKNMNAAKMKKLLSQSILECIKIDPEIGMEIVDSYRKNWLKKMDVPDTNSFQNLDEFINFRHLNAGAESVPYKILTASRFD